MSLIPQENGSYRHPDDPGEPTTGDPRLSVTDLEADILAALVAGHDVLEIGTGLGVSTRAMAATACSVTTLDVDEWVHATIWPTLPDNVTGARSTAELLGTYGAVFIDADHSTEAVARDLELALKVCECGVILAHDTGSKHVRDGLRAADGWHWIGTTHGIGVLWT
jgi:hypothetical protein